MPIKIESIEEKGYLELNYGQIILPDDLAQIDHNNLYELEKDLGKLGTRSAAGDKYSKYHLKTFRKIKKEEGEENQNDIIFDELNPPAPKVSDLKPNKYKYYYDKGCYFLSETHRGFIIDHENEIISTSLRNWRQELMRGYKEIGQEELFSKLSYSFKKKVCNYFNIKYESISITEEIKNKIINYLKEERAFNADSALRPEKEYLDFCYEMAEKKLIGNIKDRFYVEVIEKDKIIA